MSVLITPQDVVSMRSENSPNNLVKSPLSNFSCLEWHFLSKLLIVSLFIECQLCFIVMSETGISIFVESESRSEILMVLHVAFLLCG